jgi:alpha-galactosidase
LSTRYAVASFGVLGYETNISDASAAELAEMKAQIALYKQWRKTLQFGQWYRLGGSVLERDRAYHKCFEKDLVKWMAVSEDGKTAVAVTVQGQVTPHSGHHVLKTRGLKEDAAYHFYNIPVKHDLHRFGELINMIAPIHIKQDSLLHDTIAKFVKMDGAKEDFVVSGALLNKAGMHLAQTFAGTGYNGGTELYQDYDAAIYYIEEVKQ